MCCGGLMLVCFFCIFIIVYLDILLIGWLFWGFVLFVFCFVVYFGDVDGIDMVIVE